ncbi:cell division protein ZipA [Alkalispirillum mobile]|uniref:Cell division protein ZipA n=1 Tax=Alkalispirillum mobile TaxID=85925 RepID=A0A498CFH7_9GAMM|nr:cell division protein ZipA [Alkalispirillum mobile]RLK51041.1 cell division protein ZipA [Alkalispirillum mobile]
MDPFRWLLIILGLLLIAGIYAWGRWQDKKHARREDFRSAFDDMDSAVGSDDGFDVIVKTPRREGEPDEAAPARGQGQRREPTGFDADLDWPDEPEPSLGLDDEPGSPGFNEPEPEPEPVRRRPAAPPTARREPTRAPGTTEAPEAPAPAPRVRRRAEPQPEPAPATRPAPRAPEPAPPAEDPVRDRPDLAALGRNNPRPEPARPEPELPAGPQVDIDAAGLEDKIVAIHVAAPEGHVFAADALVDALERAGLEYGEHGIFHRHVRTEQGPARVFSAANMIKPGWFDLDRAAQDETPGAAFFLQLPGPVDGMAAFDDMLRVARDVADRLGGRLLDARRCDLSRQAMEHIREELREYRRRLHLAARQQQV